MILMRHPDNQDLLNYTVIDCLNNRIVQTASGATRRWYGTTYRPALPADYDYEQSTTGNYNMSILIDGAKPGNQFEFEIVNYYEYLGPTFGTSKSHTDVEGLSFIRNSLPVSDPAVPTNTLWTSALGALRSESFQSGVQKYLIPAAMAKLGL